MTSWGSVTGWSWRCGGKRTTAPAAFQAQPRPEMPKQGAQQFRVILFQLQQAAVKVAGAERRERREMVHAPSVTRHDNVMLCNTAHFADFF